MSGRTIETVRLRRVTPPSDVATLTPTIIKQLLDLIQSGQLRLGSRLPPERELALSLGVSRPSVRQAVKALEAMGIIVCRVGSGNFRPGSGACQSPTLSSHSTLSGGDGKGED